MKIEELFEYLKQNLYTPVSTALKVNSFLIEEDDSLLVQLPYTSDFVSRFYQYLQLRVFVSHGHLIPGLNLNSFLENIGSWSAGSIDLPSKNLCDILKESIELKDNRLYLGLRYLANDGFASWELQLNGSKLTIRDWINGWDDGSVLENYLSDYNEISPWQEGILSHFGGYLDENHVCLDVEITTQEDFIKGIIRYLYMTVLISSGHRYLD